MVKHTAKVYRSTFRQLPFAAPYWLATDKTVTPFLKVGRATRKLGDGTTTAVADTSVAVVRVPRNQLLPA